MTKQTHRRRVAKIQQHLIFDKYDLYRRAVQSPDTDVLFLRKTFRELKKRDPRSLREDFCGTFLLSTEWVKLHPKFEAFGVDLDPEPIEYGKAHYLPKLKADQQKRIHLLEKNVMSSGLPVVDLAIAMNFSYFLFKRRSELLSYFKNSIKSIRKDGLMIIDLFGGSLCQDQNEEVTHHRSFNYYWDQTSFDPVSNRALFHIHFKPKGMKKQERVFSYDWRMWTLPELRELLLEAGFRKTHVYWEGTTKRGDGDGVFTRTEKGEACQSWIAYIAAEK